MENKIFKGELKYLNPNKILNINDDQKVDSFFLALGLIFNDLKGIHIFAQTIQNIYKKPEEVETTYHAGEYNGLMSQLDRLTIGIISEFFELVNKQKEIFNDMNYKSIINSLHKETVNDWNIILKTNDQILRKISNIRSNVVHHYDYQNLERLKEGYNHAFFGQRKKFPQHKNAFYSTGKKIQEIRFFYCDAAAEDYIHKTLSDNGKSDLKKITNKLLVTIGSIVIGYVKMKDK